MDLESRNIGVLFVDDTDELLDLVTSIARKMGLHTYRANTPDEAKETFEENENIKVVFCDLNLGQDQENGLELIREFAAYRDRREVKLCLLTGERGGGIKDVASSLGADEYVAKPINPIKFREVILSLLNLDSKDEVLDSHIKISLENIHAGIQDSNIRPIIHIKEITPNSIVLECSADIEKGTVIKIYSKKLGNMLDCTPFFSLKIERCRSFHQIEKESGESWWEHQPHLKPLNDDHYIIRCRFIDLTNEIMAAVELFYRTLQGRKLRVAVGDQ